jgi:monolysocardiolipin acyltransferase
LKWGTASLIARAAVSPIVLPIAHSGFEKVLPENYWRGRRPLVPLWMKHISIVVGEPIQFDVPGLKLPMTGPGLLQVLMIPMANYFSP